MIENMLDCNMLRFIRKLFNRKKKRRLIRAIEKDRLEVRGQKTDNSCAKKGSA